MSDGYIAALHAHWNRALTAARLCHWRLAVRPRRGTIADVQARKRERESSGLRYAERPRVSVIIQSFNQVRNIAVLESRLRRTCADELIVCEDGSVDGSHEEWKGRLTRPNDFLLHSNDLHEIRSYDRAIGFARGEIVCLMQDDDRPPANGEWLASALELFARHPRVAVLGGWCGFDDFFATETNTPWSAVGEGRIDTVEPAIGLPMVFVENVNIGPYLVRRSAYQELGGFDLSFSPPGEPGITFEADLCYRAWERGWEVALTDIPVKQTDGSEGYALPGGTYLWGQVARERNELANKQRLEERYADCLPTIQSAVTRANRRLVSAA